MGLLSRFLWDCCRGLRHTTWKEAFGSMGLAWGVANGLMLLAGLESVGDASATLNIEQLWAIDTHMVMESAPMAVDLDGDGDAEILTAAYENIIAVDGAGTELWRYDTRGRYMTYAAILERDNERPLIYAGDNTGLFTCLDGTGQVVWQEETEAIMSAAPAVADLNGDGTPEVIQGDKSGTVSVFDALTGRRLWQKAIQGQCASPAVGDLDSDGSPEVVITTGAGKVFALSALGEVLWEFELGGTSPDWATSSPVVFGNSKGETCVAAASSRQWFYCLDGRGGLLWERPTRGAVASSISVSDFDGDGRADLFGVTQLGQLYRFDEEGRVLWDIDTQGRSLAPGAIIDVNGDNALEYVLCTQNGNLLVFSNSGQIIFNYQFENRTINMTPAFGDIVTTRDGLEFAVTGGESGRLFCFGTSAPIDAEAPWRTYRGDNRLSGAWFELVSPNTVRMTPENLDWDRLYTGGDIVFRVTDPESHDSPLRAEASCVRPDKSLQAALGRVIGSHGVLHLPVSMTAPGLYRFEWRLLDRSGKMLFTGSRDLPLQPYVNDLAVARQAAVSLREAVGPSPAVESDTGVKAALLRELQEIENEANSLASVQSATPGASPAFVKDVNDRTAALTRRAKRAQALAETVRLLAGEALNTEVIPFEGTTWENREVDTEVPLSATAAFSIKRRCVPDEHEPVSIKLLNVTPATVRVNARADTAPQGPFVTAYKVRPVPTHQDTVAWDPFVKLSDGAVEIPSLKTGEIWLDIDLTRVSPGVHPVTVTFSTGKSNVVVEIELEVLPFKMAGFGAMRLCCWARYNDFAVKDLLAHGNNVFVVPLPKATVSQGDTPRIDIDFTQTAEFVARLQGHDIFLLMSGVPSLGTPVEDERYVSHIADYLHQVMAYLAEHSIDEDRVAFYPYDEPGGAGWDTVNRYIAFARQAIKARPGTRFYVNGGGDLPMFEALDEVADIWCPSFYMLSEASPVMDFLRRSGKTLWTYDCGYAYSRPIGANTKTTNLVAQYRMAAPFAFSFGASGIGYWCYNVGPSMWQAIKDEYPLVYENPDGTSATCRRWEAVREGMEDARILIALREKLADGSVSAAAKTKIRDLLEESLRNLADQALDEARLGVARYVLDTSYNDATVQILRDEIMDCVALLNSKEVRNSGAEGIHKE